MTEKWESFAEADAFGYIMTDLAHAGPGTFWESGEKTVRDELLPIAEEFDVPKEIGLEIGCGVGRLVLPLSRVFRQTIGVDISKGMVRRAAECAHQRGIMNAQFVAIREPGELPRTIPEIVGQVSFLYSLLVFQHIPAFETIESYLRVVRQLLSRKGVAYLQFDTRSRTLPYRIKTATPDFLLPRLWRRGIRRVRRNPSEVDAALARNGLRPIREVTPGSAHHRYVVVST